MINNYNNKSYKTNEIHVILVLSFEMDYFQPQSSPWL